MTNSVYPNLGQCRNWQPLLCANLAKQAALSSTLRNAANQEVPLPSFDADGYPTALLAGQSARWAFDATPNGGFDSNHWGDGLYDITWQGTATLAVRGAASVVSRGANTMRILVTSVPRTGGGVNGIWFLDVSAMGVAPNHMHGLDIRRVGLASAALVNPELSALLGATRFEGLRLMNAQAILDRGSDIANWADRPKLTDARWDRGIPLEMAEALAHATPGGSLWACLPHLATDDYGHAFGAWLKPRLAAGLKIVLEYANEVWNGDYAVTRYARDQGQAMGFHYASYPVRSGATDLNLGMLRWYAYRACQLFDIIRAEVGTLSSQVTFVAAVQCANGTGWNSANVLDFVAPGSTLPVGRRVNALAIAPYPALNFGNPGIPASVEAAVDAILAGGVDGTFALLNANMSALFATAVGAPRPVFSHQANARRYGLRLMSYEGGPSLVTPNLATIVSATVTPEHAAANVARIAALVDLYRRMNLDPRMGQFVTTLLTNWARFTPEAFTYFCLVSPEGGGAVGSFGAKRFCTEPDAAAPKWQALKAWADAHPA